MLNQLIGVDKDGYNYSRQLKVLKDLFFQAQIPKEKVVLDAAINPIS
jgi:hypothetical protein